MGARAPARNPLVHSYLCVALALACGSDALRDRPCSAEGTCLEGYRCREGRCVLKTAEVCNGEDDDDNGFVDEGLYYPLAFTSVSADTFATDASVAQSGDRYLFLRSEKTTEGSALSSLLLDAQGAPLHEKVVLDSVATSFTALAAGTPTGFVVAYAPSTLAGEDVALSFVAVDRQGTASAPIPETIPPGSVLALGVTAEGPVAATVPECRGCLPYYGVSLHRPGLAAELVLDSDDVDWRTPFTLAASADRLALAWIDPPGVAPARVCGGRCPNQLSHAEIRVLTSAGTYQATLDGADGIDIAWNGDELVAIWRDTRQGLDPRVRLTRFDPQAQVKGALEVSDRAGASPLFALTAGAGELGLLWSVQNAGGAESSTFFARIDPTRGRIGAEVPVPTPRSFPTQMHLFFTGSGYDAWPSVLGFHQVRCTNAPPTPSDDGGADGGAGDGGTEDGGAADGGSGGTDGGVVVTGPICPVDADGGPLVEGAIRWLAGDPAAGLDVVVGACRVVTDADGRFRAAAVPSPYSLTLIVPRRDGITTVSYLDLETAAPDIRIEIPNPNIPTEARATLSGTYADPLDGGTARLFTRIAGMSSLQSSVSPGAWQDMVSWTGPSTVSGAALFLERAASGAFTRAQTFEELTVTDGLTTDLGTFAPVAINSALVRVDLPVAPHASATAAVYVGGETFQVASPDPTLHVPVPVFEAPLGAQGYVIATVTDDANAGAILASDPLAASDTAVTFATPPAATPLAPEANATGVGPSPRFEIAPVDGATVYVVVLRSPDIFHILFAGGPSLTLPDLDAFGVGFAVGESLWGAAILTGPAGATTFVDAVSGARFPLRASGLLGPGLGMLQSGFRALTR